MKDFFQGQIDYVYFLYGFSFFVLALVCLTISRTGRTKPPWHLLGLFGLFHTIGEWFHMLILMYGLDYFTPLHSLTLGISYLFLFEFARVSIWRIKSIKISKWLYLPFIVLLIAGYRYGADNWAVMIRYFIGFPASYVCARLIYEFSKTEKVGRRWLFSLSLIISIYAVLTGLIGPKAAFIPARFLNYESFFNTFYVPAELVRAILILSAGLLIWFYSSTVSMAEPEPSAPTLRFVPTHRMLVIILILLIGAGWMFTNYLDDYAGVEMIRIKKAKKNSPISALTDELDTLGRASYLLSKAGAIRGIVSSPKGAQSTEKIYTLLNHYKDKYWALDCAVLDAHGKTLAAITDKDSEIKMNKSYASRPYFKQALSGDNGYYIKSGTVYNEVIYYVSYPVYNTAGKISGIVVIVKKIYAEPLFQYRFLGIVATFIACIIAIIFFIILKRRETLIVLIKKVDEHLRQIDRMKTDFVSIVSHELRTPLTSIKNAASILKQGGASRRLVEPQEKELLEIIINNVDRQTRMVSDLLDISKIEAGVMQVFAEPVAISAAIKETIASLAPQADEKKIKISVNIDEPEIIVFADFEHLKRIMDNLVINAIKFTLGGGKIEIKARRLATQAQITVSDNGIGIPDIDQKKIFDKFCRPATSGVSHKGGCGLGLAITKSLVEAQGGTIWLESEPGKGTSFHFTLPLFKKG